MNLRAAFTAGLDSPITAQQVFTDRVDEIAGFFTALDELDGELARAEVSPVVDRSRGRRNVLVFYGVGGIGKTTLSHELERRFRADTETRDRSGAVSIRVDLAEDGATDVETLVLRLRAGLGRLGSKWSAFDLALACYWARAHPGERLQEFLDTSPMIRRLARDLRLSEQIAQNVSSIVPESLGLSGLGAAGRAGMAVYRAARDRFRQGRLLAGCDLLGELLEADADHETLSYFPYLLAWDLDRYREPRQRRPSVCVFLDTFETVTERPDRRVERLIQRCLYLMPNVLFVVTGRNRIDWADQGTSSELDFTGKDRWPTLHFSNHITEPRQHLVGYLSDSDADGYLKAALTEEGQPAIPDGIRRRIIAGAQGLPLYLDLSVSHYVELLAVGRQPHVEDFGGSFTAVATRTISDLATEERDLVRTAALVERFDAALLRAAQANLPDGRIVRFLRRSFLIRDDAYELPYTLHLALRRAIADADRMMPDGWSDRDRDEAAQRLLQGLGARAAAATDRLALSEALEAGLKLADEQGVFDDWLVHATQSLIEAGQWSALGGWTTVDETARRELRGLSAAIGGVLLRREGDASAAASALEQAADLVDPGSAAGNLIQLHLAHALRNTGDYSRAAEIYRTLLDSEVHDTARYWLCDHDYLNGRFRTALAQLDAWQGHNPAEEGERLRLVGHIFRVNARFDDAVATYRRAVELASTEGLVAAEAKALVNVAQSLCWSGHTHDIAEAARRARDLLELVPNPVELVKLRSAEAVAAAATGDHEGAVTAVDETNQLAEQIGYRGGRNLADVADILLRVRRGDISTGRETLQRLADRTQGSGGNFYWVPIAATWIGDTTQYDESWRGIQWLDGAETLRHWSQIPGG